MRTLRKKRSSLNIEVVSEQDLVACITIYGSHMMNFIKNEQGEWFFEITGQMKLLGKPDPAHGQRLPTLAPHNK